MIKDVLVYTQAMYSRGTYQEKAHTFSAQDVSSVFATFISDLREIHNRPPSPEAFGNCPYTPPSLFASPSYWQRGHMHNLTHLVWRTKPFISVILSSKDRSRLTRQKVCSS